MLSPSLDILSVENEPCDIYELKRFWVWGWDLQAHRS